MTRKNLDWDDIYNYIQVAPKDKCLAIVELINRKYGWEDGIPEKTLDDFTMDEILTYANAYKGKGVDNNRKKYLETRRSENKYFGLKCSELTLDQFKEAVTPDIKSTSEVLSFLKDGDYADVGFFRKVAKMANPTDEILSLIYNRSQTVKVKNNTIGKWYTTNYIGAFASGFERMNKLGIIEPVLDILSHKELNKLNRLVYRTPNSSYCHVGDTGFMTESALYDSIYNLIDAELDNKYNFRGNDLICIRFPYNKSGDKRTTLERLSDVFGYKVVLKLLKDVGFENVSIDMISNKSFICNIHLSPVLEKIVSNVALSPQVSRAINEFKCFWIDGRFKIYDVYATFVNKLSELIKNSKINYQGYVSDIIVQSGLFGSILLSDRGSKHYVRDRVNKLPLSDLLTKINKFNRGIGAGCGLAVMNSPKLLKLSDIKWKHGRTYIAPQTPIYLLLKVGITNKELQKVIHCTSNEVVAAAKDDNIWINSPDNWEKGVLKDMCRLCIKHGVSHSRLSQMLSIVETSKLYQIYYNLIREEPKLVQELGLRK